MRRFFLSVLLFPIAFTSSYAATEVSNNEWMKYIPGDTYVCTMTIPGTHDSATYALNAAEGIWGKCQHVNLSDQFSRGARFFDLRPGICYFGFAAGPVDVNILCRRQTCKHGILDTGVHFKDALTELVELVKAHPSEFIICQVSFEGSSNGASDEQASLMVAHVTESIVARENRTQFVEYKPDLTLDECRGKILIINRDPYFADKDIILSEWIGDETHGMYKRNNFTNKGQVFPVGAYTYNWKEDDCNLCSGDSNSGINLTRFIVQDIDNSEDDFKIRLKVGAIYRTSREFMGRDEYFTWCFNSIAGYYQPTGPFMSYTQHAEKISPAVIELANFALDNFYSQIDDHWGLTGIVMMDFLGDYGVEGYLIKCNNLQDTPCY